MLKRLEELEQAWLTLRAERTTCDRDAGPTSGLGDFPKDSDATVAARTCLLRAGRAPSAQPPPLLRRPAARGLRRGRVRARAHHPKAQ